MIFEDTVPKRNFVVILFLNKAQQKILMSIFCPVGSNKKKVQFLKNLRQHKKNNKTQSHIVPF